MATLRPVSRLIVVRRLDFRLELYGRGPLSNKPKLIHNYRIAVGAEGHRTPAGLYTVLAKARNPEWRMPESDWVPKENWGKVIPGGDPSNPIRERFIKLTDDGVGIHGTLNLDSLGTAASHGCIRMDPKDVIELYDLVPTGSWVYIV